MNGRQSPGEKDDEVEESIMLSKADSDLLRYYLENPPDPNPALKAAYDRIVKRSYLNEKGEVIYEVDHLLLKQSKIIGEDPE